MTPARCPACGAEVAARPGAFRPGGFCGDGCRVRLTALRRALVDELGRQPLEQARVAAVRALWAGGGH